MGDWTQPAELPYLVAQWCSTQPRTLKVEGCRFKSQQFFSEKQLPWDLLLITFLIGILVFITVLDKDVLCKYKCVYIHVCVCSCILNTSCRYHYNWTGHAWWHWLRTEGDTHNIHVRTWCICTSSYMNLCSDANCFIQAKERLLRGEELEESFVVDVILEKLNSPEIKHYGKLHTSTALMLHQDQHLHMWMHHSFQITKYNIPLFVHSNSYTCMCAQYNIHVLASYLPRILPGYVLDGLPSPGQHWKSVPEQVQLLQDLDLPPDIIINLKVCNFHYSYSTDCVHYVIFTMLP